MENNRAEPIDESKQRVCLLVISDENNAISALVKVLESLGCSILTKLVSICTEEEILAMSQSVAQQYQNMFKDSSVKSTPVIVNCHLGPDKWSKHLGLDLALALRARIDVPVFLWSFLDTEKLVENGAGLIKYSGRSCLINAPSLIAEFLEAKASKFSDADHRLLEKEKYAACRFERAIRLKRAGEAIDSFGHHAEKLNTTDESIRLGLTDLNKTLNSFGFKLGPYLKKWKQILIRELETRSGTNKRQQVGNALKKAGLALNQLAGAYKLEQSAIGCDIWEEAIGNAWELTDGILKWYKINIRRTPKIFRDLKAKLKSLKLQYSECTSSLEQLISFFVVEISNRRNFK